MKKLVHELEKELERSGHVQSNSVQIMGVNGDQNYILLTGRVKSFYKMQMAQEVIMRRLRRENRDISLRNEIVVDF